MKKREPKKLFVVRKYIYANSASETIKKDRTHKVDDVWWDDEHKKRVTRPADSIGFHEEENNNDSEED